MFPSSRPGVAGAARLAAGLAAAALTTAPAARAWDGAAWADPSAFLGPMDEAVKQHLQAVVAAGVVAGRVEGRLGQIGDSITFSSAYFRNAVLGGPASNETGHDYAPIRSWLAYAGTQPADANSFYRDHGKGAAWGNGSGWTVPDAAAEGHPAAGVLTGDDGVPGEYSWVLIMFGTNDIDAGSWSAAAWKETLRGFVQGYVALGVVPVLSTIPPEVAHLADGRVAAANAALVALAAEERIPWVDYHGLILGYQPVNWVGTLIGADGTHPTAGTGGLGFSFAALTSTDGYALRTKLAFDAAEKLRRIVWDGGPADPVTAAPAAAGPHVSDGWLAVFPNPARAAATVRLARARGAGAALEVFDAGGRRVRAWPHGGPAEWRWDLRDAAGRPVPAGVYFLRADRATARLVVAR